MGAGLGARTVMWSVVVAFVLLPLLGGQAHEHESHSGSAEACVYCAAATMSGAPSPAVHRTSGSPPPTVPFVPKPYTGPRLEATHAPVRGARGPPLQAF